MQGFMTLHLYPNDQRSECYVNVYNADGFLYAGYGYDTREHRAAYTTHRHPIAYRINVRRKPAPRRRLPVHPMTEASHG